MGFKSTERWAWSSMMHSRATGLRRPFWRRTLVSKHGCVTGRRYPPGIRWICDALTFKHPLDVSLFFSVKRQDSIEPKLTYLAPPKPTSVTTVYPSLSSSFSVGSRDRRRGQSSTWWFCGRHVGWQLQILLRPGGVLGTPEPLAVPLASMTIAGLALVRGALSEAGNFTLRKASTCPMYFRRLLRFFRFLQPPSTDSSSMTAFRWVSL